MEEKTKKELIKEFQEILNKLIEKGSLRYYPFKRKLERFDKNFLKKGIEIHKKKLKNLLNTIEGHS